MKRLITTTIFAIAFMMNLNAHNTDGFFAYSSIDSNRGGSSEWGAIPTLPSSHGFDFDQNAAPAPKAYYYYHHFYIQTSEYQCFNSNIF